MRGYTRANIVEHMEIMNCILGKNYILGQIEGVAGEIIKCYKKGGKVLACGNGGSAADAGHFIGELVGKFGKDRRPLEAIDLVASIPTITAVSNDYGYQLLFERSIAAHAKKGDVVLAISTSGNSSNIIYGVRKAKELEVITVGLTGKDRCLLDKEKLNYLIRAPSTNTPRIQEAHGLILHLICGHVENELFNK